MRYAVISDIHSNRQALRAVLKDINNLGADRIVCLGDIVGYGPSPIAVMDSLRSSVSHFVLGNHDAVAAGYINSDNFNLSAAKTIEWTSKQLDGDAVKFLKSMPLLLTGNNIRFAHGEFKNPGRFGYIDDENSALTTFNATNESLLMAGHSHVPGIFVIGNSGVPHWLKPQNFNFESHKRYIVNVGSVGQPRDNDNRASYCIIDDGVNDVLFRKVEFDIEGYKRDLKKNSLPAVSGFLFIDKSTSVKKRKPTAKSAEKADFTPLSKKDAVKITQEVQELKETVNRLQKSQKKLFGIVILLGFALVALPACFFLMNKQNAKIADSNITKIPAAIKRTPSGVSTKITKHTELLSMPKSNISVSSDSPLKYWNIAVTSPDKQKIHTIEVIDSKKKKLSAFKLSSSSMGLILIDSFPIPASKGNRFTASAQFKAVNKFSGVVELRLKQIFPDGTEKILLSREPKNLAKSAKWVFTSVTIPKKDSISRKSQVVFEIYCKIKGGVLVRKCSLKTKK